jgi:RNA polymerase sigma factor (sigma-70 family)
MPATPGRFDSARVHIEISQTMTLAGGDVTRAEDPDWLLIRRLRAGDENAFAELVEKYRTAMLSMALSYVPSRAVAEEVVQDAWMGVLRGIQVFEGRSSLRTWLFRILINRAISAATRERRSVPVDDMQPVVEASRFDAAGNWQVPPEPWADLVEEGDGGEDGCSCRGRDRRAPGAAERGRDTARRAGPEQRGSV